MDPIFLCSHPRSLGPGHFPSSGRCPKPGPRQRSCQEGPVLTLQGPVGAPAGPCTPPGSREPCWSPEGASPLSPGTLLSRVQTRSHQQIPLPPTKPKGCTASVVRVPAPCPRLHPPPRDRAPARQLHGPTPGDPPPPGDVKQLRNNALQTKAKAYSEGCEVGPTPPRPPSPQLWASPHAARQPGARRHRKGPRSLAPSPGSSHLGG